ncbi:MAG: glycosyltransferase family 4 protein [Bacteroidetes bacterium]|nr:glycosyltransferase family 4 protein [Bacteroidota bacterium]MCL1969741.1 glycosyltransferase family 4 protein [Bacteroidota bacterium]
MKKLLLTGSNTIHTFNYFQLIEDYFDEIVLITVTKNEFESQKLTRKYAVYSSLKNPFNYFTAIHKYQTILEKEKPDIIHIQQISTYTLLLMKALKKSKLSIPVVVTAWGSDVLVNPKKGWLYKKMVQYVLNHGDAFTADAQFLADEMQKLTQKKLPIAIANFGINVEDIPIRKCNIIYSNRLHKPLYRIDKIIIAFSRFVKHHSDWQLVVAATGTETENLKQLCNTLEIDSNVEFIGWVDSKINSENYAKAKIWVSIPESDATAISLLEAMSMGCIPVVSHLPANKEWIQNQVNGIVVDNADHDFLSEALLLNQDTVTEINKEIIAQKGTKEVNRKIFYRIYDDIFSHYPQMAAHLSI